MTMGDRIPATRPHLSGGDTKPGTTPRDTHPTHTEPTGRAGSLTPAAEPSSTPSREA